jgi:fatty acid desaturase
MSTPEENLDAAVQALGDKPWWQSKIIRINLLALALAALEANITALQGHIPGGLLAWLTVVLPIVNIGLRFITRAGVRL